MGPCFGFILLTLWVKEWCWVTLYLSACSHWDMGWREMGVIYLWYQGQKCIGLQAEMEEWTPQYSNPANNGGWNNDQTNSSIINTPFFMWSNKMTEWLCTVKAPGRSRQRNDTYSPRCLFCIVHCFSICNRPLCNSTAATKSIGLVDTCALSAYLFTKNQTQVEIVFGFL